MISLMAVRLGIEASSYIVEVGSRKVMVTIREIFNNFICIMH